MNTDVIKKHWQILLLNFTIILCFIIFYGHFGDIIFDSFREAYIPEQIVKGDILYKNIFNIYAPFSYLFNALMFKIFGINLSVLYILGLLSTLGIANLLFLISNIFLEKNYSLAIIIFFTFTSILSPNVFNLFFPYSYGMLYGLLFITASFFCLLKDKYSLSYLMYSFAICSKYEFLLLLPVIIIASWKNKSCKYLIPFFTPILITFFPLFIQHVGIDNLVATAQIILKMSSTKTLYWFYSVSGLTFRPELLLIYLENIIKIAIPLVFSYFINNKIIFPILFLYCYFLITPELIIYIFPLILFLLAIRIKKVSYKEKIFIISTLLISVKTFFSLVLLSYGTYFTPFALISIFILCPNKLKKHLMTLFLICSISLGIKNIQTLNSKNVKIETQKGVIYTQKASGISINELIQYLLTNTSKKDKIVIYPECLAVNFLADRNSDNKFYSLIPLYVETFGEEIISKRIEKLKPPYIIISNTDTSNYYYSSFGIDYAEKIFKYIINNYEKIENFNNTLNFSVFKRLPTHPSHKLAL